MNHCQVLSLILSPFIDRLHSGVLFSPGDSVTSPGKKVAKPAGQEAVAGILLSRKLELLKATVKSFPRRAAVQRQDLPSLNEVELSL